MPGWRCKAASAAAPPVADDLAQTVAQLLIIDGSRAVLQVQRVAWGQQGIASEYTHEHQPRFKAVSAAERNACLRELAAQGLQAVRRLLNYNVALRTVAAEQVCQLLLLQRVAAVGKRRVDDIRAAQGGVERVRYASAAHTQLAAA